MGASKLIINPNLPVCWEDDRTLRIGFESACARLPRPSGAGHRFLESLLRGVEPHDVERLARTAGIQHTTMENMLTALAPVLMHAQGELVSRNRSKEYDARLRVIVSCGDRPVEGLHEALEGVGFLLRQPGDEEIAETDLVIFAERHLEGLHRAQRWLITGMPMLLIRYTDTSMHIGPLIEPPGDPCHACVSLTLVERDPALPLLAAQLVGVRPRSESWLTAQLAAVYAAALVHEWRTPRWQLLPQVRLPQPPLGVAAARATPGTDAPAAAAGAWNPRTTRIVIPTDNGRLAGPPRYETVHSRSDCGCGFAALSEAA